MRIHRIAGLLLLTMALGACSRGDAPPAPTVAGTAHAADIAPAPPVTSDAAPPSTATPATEPAAPAPAAPPSSTPAASAAGDTAAPTYQVQCPDGASSAEQCQVDKDTYIGWRTFSGQCQVCHGGSALGSTFAPNLLDRFHERVDYARFIEVVTNGFRGQVGAMPAWKGNPNVMPHVDQLYRYLKARAAGDLPPGRPARLP